MESEIVSPIKGSYILNFFIVFVIIYSSVSKMQIPSFITDLFKYDYVRALFLSLLLIFNFTNAPYAAMAIVILFVISMNHIANEKKENFISYYKKEKFQNQY